MFCSKVHSKLWIRNNYQKKGVLILKPARSLQYALTFSLNEQLQLHPLQEGILPTTYQGTCGGVPCSVLDASEEDGK